MGEAIIELDLGLHPDQAGVYLDPHRFRLIVTGRRWGKSRLIARYLLEGALQGQPTAWVLPTYPMGTPQWRLVKRLVKGLPGIHLDNTNRRVDFPGDGFLDFKSAEREDSIRGDGYARVGVDEACFLREAAWLNEVRPSLSDLQGSAILASSPRGMGSWVYRTAMLIKAGKLPNWSYHQFPTSSNPYIHAAEIEEARATLPARVFGQEYLAEWLEIGTGLFTAIMEAAHAVSQQSRAVIVDEQGNPVLGADGKPQDAGHTYVAGLDLARQRDYTVLTIADTDLPVPSAVFIDRFNRMTWGSMCRRIRDSVMEFKVDRLVVDATGVGDPITEKLQDEFGDVVSVDPFIFSGASKPPLLEDLALAIERGEFQYIPDQDLITELQALETKATPTGRARYEAPSGMHDDLVMSLALCWRACNRGLSLGIL